MTNFRHLFMLTALGAMTLTAAQAKTVTVSCSFIDAIELRDGGMEGEVVDLQYSGQKITLNGEALYVGLKDDTKVLERVAYNSYYAADIYNGSYSIIPMEYINDESFLNIDVSTPKLVTLNVPDPELVTVKNGMYGAEFNVVAGLNTLKVSQSGALYVGVKDTNAYKMTEFRNTNNGNTYQVESFAAACVYSYQLNNGDAFEYTIIPASELVLPKFTLTVDDPTKVSVLVDGRNIDGLVANEPNEIEITSGLSASVTVRAATYGDSLFQVTLNGVAQTESYSSYYLYGVKDGDVINVQANYPDKDCVINLTTNPAENAAFITSVTADGVNIENWAEPFTVKAGTKLHLTFDTAAYNYRSLSINGSAFTGYVYNSADIKITDNSAIEVVCEKIPVETATINISDPKGVTCVLAYSKTLNLNEGANVVEFATNSGGNTLSVRRNSGYILNSIVTVDYTDPMNPVTQSYAGSESYYIYLTAGMDVTISVSEIVKDQEIVLYSSHDFDHPDFQYVQFYAAGESYMDGVKHKQGYNTVKFAESQKTHYLSAYSSVTGQVPTYVYQNGELVSSRQAGACNYELNFNHGDVVKTYFFNEPAEVAAIFDVDDDCDVTIRKNLIQDVDLTEDDVVYDLEGTLVQIASNNEEGIAVCVMDLDMAGFLLDDEEDPGMGIDPTQNLVQADENGVFNVTLTGSHYIVVRPADVVAVKALSADLLGNDVFSLTGVRVAKNASRADLEKLPAGIYVCAGKKIVVR